MKSVEVGKPLQFLKSKGQRIVEPNEKKLNMFIFNILYVGVALCITVCIARAHHLYGRSPFEAGEYGGPFIPVWLTLCNGMSIKDCR